MAEEPFGALEKAEIVTEVKAVLDTMVEGMNEHDVDQIMSLYQKGDRLIVVGNGIFSEGWDSLYALVNDFHTDPANESARVSIDEVRIEALSRDLAVLMASGRQTRVDEQGAETSVGYSLTDVLVRAGNTWIIINEHESLGCPVAASEG
jgi:uncharacterized protein (TIGR02246 family)